jgi:hypothetical protein
MSIVVMYIFSSTYVYKNLTNDRQNVISHLLGRQRSLLFHTAYSLRGTSSVFHSLSSYSPHLPSTRCSSRQWTQSRTTTLLFHLKPLHPVQCHPTQPATHPPLRLRRLPSAMHHLRTISLLSQPQFILNERRLERRQNELIDGGIQCMHEQTHLLKLPQTTWTSLRPLVMRRLVT